MIQRLKGGLLLAVAAVASVVFGGGQAFAVNATQLPDIGVDMTAITTDYGTKLGTVVAAALVLVLAVVLVRKGVRWLRGA